MVEVMLTLFAIVIVGYVAGKFGYMGGIFDKRLSKLVIDITCPALILSSAMTGKLPDSRFIIPLLTISVVTYIVLTVVALLLPRYLTRRPSDHGVIGFALMFGNVGFMGYPVVASIFGHEAVFYAAVLNVVNTFTVFTIGTMLIMGRGDNRAADNAATGVPSAVGPAVSAAEGKGTLFGAKFQRKVLYGTPMIAAYLTMLIVALKIDNIPTVISQPLTMIGNITVPAALLIIGSSMSHLPLRAMLGNVTVYATTIFRLALLPLAVHGLCTLMGFSPFVVGINTVVIAMPVATYGTILCLRYGRDTTLMTELTFITTLLSMITIPLLVTFLV